MIEAKLDGMSLREIAKQHNYHRDTVRHWWRQYRDGGWEALCPRPRQRPERGVLSTFDPKVRYVILRLKCEHHKWGADLILHKLRQRASLKGLSLPSRSSIAAYLKPYLRRLQDKRRATLKRPSAAKPHITEVHQCWQMDFKGDENLGACGDFAPFKVVDVLTSAPLETRLYPARLKGLTYRAVQANLRLVFAQWGLPD
jgi:Helix-turn-helix domain